MPPVLLALAGHALPKPLPVDADATLRATLEAYLSSDPATRPSAAHLHERLAAVSRDTTN